MEAEKLVGKADIVGDLEVAVDNDWNVGYRRPWRRGCDVIGAFELEARSSSGPVENCFVSGNRVDVECGATITAGNVESVSATCPGAQFVDRDHEGRVGGDMERVGAGLSHQAGSASPGVSQVVEAEVGGVEAVGVGSAKEVGGRRGECDGDAGVGCSIFESVGNIAAIART